MEFVDREILSEWGQSVVVPGSLLDSERIPEDLTWIKQLKLVVEEGKWRRATEDWRRLGDPWFEPDFDRYEELKKGKFFGLRGLRKLTILGAANERWEVQERTNFRKGMCRYFEWVRKFDEWVCVPNIEFLLGGGVGG